MDYNKQKNNNIFMFKVKSGKQENIRFIVKLVGLLIASIFMKGMFN